jgi:uncharacterized protein YkwD
VLKTISFNPGKFFLISSLLFYSSAFAPATSLADDVLKYTNDFRKSKGLTKLEMRNDLNNIARKHSEDMASGRKSFGHGGFNQRSKKVENIFKTCTIAENVAYGANNAKEAVAIWKNSSGHRKNILGNYKYIGIGTARNKQGVIYYTQIFVN